MRGSQSGLQGIRAWICLPRRGSHYAIENAWVGLERAQPDEGQREARRHAHRNFPLKPQAAHRAPQAYKQGGTNKNATCTVQLGVELV